MTRVFAFLCLSFAATFVGTLHAQNTAVMEADRCGLLLGDYASRRETNPLHSAMGSLTAVYRVGAKIDRHFTTSFRLPRPVISIGNAAVGGRAKTPLTTKIAEELRASGYEPVILTRGYGRDSKEAKFLLPGQKHELDDFSAAGDEPTELYLRTNSPVLIGADRKANAKKFLAEHPDPSKVVFLLDDGSQHWKLDKDFEAVSTTKEDWSTDLAGRRYLRETIPDMRRRMQESGTRSAFLEVGKDFKKETFFKAQPSRQVKTISLTARAANQAQSSSYSGLMTSYFKDLDSVALGDHAKPQKLLQAISSSNAKQVVLGLKEAVKLFDEAGLRQLIDTGTITRRFAPWQEPKDIYLADLEVALRNENLINDILMQVENFELPANASEN
ncbi:tetraacyldisaccharide 4'-kinase [bacterium]|nr:tetraacyldisaccharide 4'-kinase [bacterium]